MINAIQSVAIFALSVGLGFAVLSIRNLTQTIRLMKIHLRGGSDAGP